MKRVEWRVAKVDRRRGAKVPFKMWGGEFETKAKALAWVRYFNAHGMTLEPVKVTLETVEKKR